MNIYNTLFILEYTKDPFSRYGKLRREKNYYLNLSKKKYDYWHRGFDLLSYFNKSVKKYHKYNILKKLIGPSIIINHYRFYYKNSHCYQIIEYEKS